MKTASISGVQRTLLIVAAAILFPSVMLVGWLFREFSINQMETLEANSRQAADLIVLLADTRAESDLTALKVLSTSQYFVADDLVGAARRAADIINLIPAWKAVILSDAHSGKVYFTATAQGSVALSDETFGEVVGDQPMGFGGVQRDGSFCPCVSLKVPVRYRPDLVLTALVDPAIFQELLVNSLPPGSVLALVDRSGNFIARSVDFGDKVGTSASQFVRDAVARGGHGIYEGTTLEGMHNYSAYTMSETTGWSSHVAVDNSLFDSPRAAARQSTVLGALAAILAGALLFTYVARDIAARRVEDRKILELQKAEAVRQFTAMVIHDFRNIAAAVQSGLKMIVRHTNETQTKTYATMIGDAMERGTRLTNRLMKFVRDNDRDIGNIEIESFLSDLEYLLQQAAGLGVAVNIEKPDMPVALKANRDQLELALVNLVVNARDAMKGRGQIGIAVTADDNHVFIRVTDDGPGIPIELRQKVFARFFTTKPEDGGSGLGLSQVAEMMRDANGQVSIEDASGGGAVFVLRFDRAAKVEEKSQTGTSPTHAVA